MREGELACPEPLAPQAVTLPGTRRAICQVALVVPAALLTITEYAPAAEGSVVNV